jgi:hypothetical protein
MYCFTHWAEAEDHDADNTCSDRIDVGNQNSGPAGPIPAYALAMAAAVAQRREGVDGHRVIAPTSSHPTLSA